MSELLLAEEAAALPEILAPPAAHGRVVGFVLRYPAIAIGGALVGLMMLLAIFAPWLGTVDPEALDPANMLIGPSAGHWFGTDMLGRDIYRACSTARASPSSSASRWPHSPRRAEWRSASSPDSSARWMRC